MASKTEIEASSEKYREYDAVIALGKNWRLPIEGKRIYLSIESKMTALAAAELYISGQVGKIIFSTGETAGRDSGGNYYSTEAEEMKRFMRIFFTEDEIPENVIELETNSFDTAGNAEEVGKILQKEKLRKLALVTVGTHLPRAKKLFADYKVPIAKSFSSEGVLRQRNPHYEKFLHEYFWSTRHLKEVGKEAIGVGLAYTVDPKGKLLRRITRETRQREEN